LELLFKSTVCVPTFSNTLLAVNKLTERGSMIFARKKYTFRFGGHTIVIPVNVDGLYILQFKVIPPPTKIPKHVHSASLSKSLGIEDQIKCLHASLGHPNLKRMKDIAKKSFSNPISGKLKQAILELDTFFCDCCHQGKAVIHSAPKKSEPRVFLPGEFFSTGISGPFPVQRGGYRYFIVLVDARTKIFFIFFSSSPNHELVTRSYIVIDREPFNRTGRHIRIVRCDNGAGFQSKFKRLCEDSGTTMIKGVFHCITHRTEEESVLFARSRKLPTPTCRRASCLLKICLML
jgi:hypothetical protein